MGFRFLNGRLAKSDWPPIREGGVQVFFLRWQLQGLSEEGMRCFPSARKLLVSRRTKRSNYRSCGLLHRLFGFGKKLNSVESRSVTIYRRT